ncbi:MAG TPA: copper resistance protein CopC, partial [Anaerolinea sp.]|nr:copper resistance protein CopC [Anaerolinea sp.]
MKQRKILTILALCLTVLFGGVSRVQAHEIEPETSQPAPGIALGESPAEVVLVFPEEINEQGSRLEVFDEAGKALEISAGGVDLNDPKHVTLRAGLPALLQGVYQVKWTIVLTDGDSSSGSYHFGVGKVIVPTEAPEEAAAVTSETGQPAGRPAASLPVILVAALVILVGAAVVV